MIRFVHERGLAHVDVAPLGLVDAFIDIWLRCRPEEVSIQYYSLFKVLGSAFSTTLAIETDIWQSFKSDLMLVWHRLRTNQK